MIGTGSLQGEASSENVVNVVDNHKGVGVNFSDDGTNLRSLGKLCHNEEHVTLTVGKCAFAVKVGYATTNNFNDGFGDRFRVVADDDNVLFEIEAYNKSVTGFSHNEHCQQSVEGRFDAKEKTANEEQNDVKHKACGTNANGVVLLNDGADNIRATATTTNAIHTGSTNAIHNAARNTAKHGVVNRVVGCHKTKEVQGEGEDEHTIECANKIFLVHKLVAQSEKGNVQNYTDDTNGEAHGIIQNSGNATDATA